MVAKAVRFKPIYATVFVGLPFFERTKKEIDSHFISGEEDHLRNLIRYHIFYNKYSLLRKELSVNTP